MLAIIGGTGLATLPILEVTHRQVVRTPYGDPSCALTFGRIGHENVVFLARHGYGHSLAPHEINYRANIWALHDQGVRGIISLGSAGGIRHDMSPGTLVVPDDIIDYTWGRKHTFFEGLDRPVVHVDFTRPFSETLRQRLLAAGSTANVPVLDGGVYACAQGPRLESRAEIRKFERDGCDIVGMTGMPEATLAREFDLPYAMLNFVVNWAAGVQDSQTSVSFPSDLQQVGVDRVHALLACLFSS
ncbi:S-methyl-5'-thioinosine phosphorylase [Pseudogulbenkiania sp. MAI-1]|uniref:S-methyl-5'-thioinosine phosphorylase n=1 Tax=Pseudogulbenkiania sp. MAI-1 TaxID=990370 RepID=UPI00045E696E|nr:S-methyl-5'-thioinosine phosphorylase [Pseudogulbenkiania sp. MAI-1]